MKTANETHRVGEYDQVFDGINGIGNAIYHDVKEWQFYYLNRFAGVKYFIAPDYSLAGDVHHIENLHRIFKARIVSIWLTLNLQSPSFPPSHIRRRKYFRSNSLSIISKNSRRSSYTPSRFTGGGGGDGLEKASEQSRNKIPDNPAIVKHIFQKKKGHLPDTPENGKLIEDVANDPNATMVKTLEEMIVTLERFQMALKCG